MAATKVTRHLPKITTAPPYSYGEHELTEDLRLPGSTDGELKRLDKLIAYHMTKLLDGQNGRGIKIDVNGTIGVGKSTVVLSMAAYMHDLGFPVASFPEPINTKQLELFYANPVREAWNMQQMQLNMRTHVGLAADQVVDAGGIAVLDRWVDGDRIFFELHCENGNIDEAHAEVYDEMWRNIRSYRPDVTVYLQCTPETAAKRIARRKRKVESGIPLEYLKQLSDAHDQTFNNANPNLKKLIIKNWEVDRSIDVRGREDWGLFDRGSQENATMKTRKIMNDMTVRMLWTDVLDSLSPSPIDWFSHD